MAAPEVATFFGRYATSFDAPIHEHTNVQRLAGSGDGFVVTTDQGRFRSDNVVIATGWCDRPAIPDAARHLSPRIHQVVPASYRSPEQLPDGGVLVVGTSATGVQLADELRASGREVTLAVGSHTRMPRRYRGMDIFWWLEMIGTFDRSIDDVRDVVAARSEPSLQLVGRPDHSTLDLATLQASGVQLVGRLTDADGSRVSFDTNLRAVTKVAEVKLALTLARIDDAVKRHGLSSEVLEAEPVASVEPVPDVASLDLAATGVRTIVWATGHRRSYEWLHLPILDDRGEIVQYRGVTPIAGAYVLGQRFQHFRNSNFIDGIGRDAQYVADHICRTHHRPNGIAVSALPEPNRG
jgi:putative flavoprotein involved in K+ transport